jgi:hypothetical protein
MVRTNHAIEPSSVPGQVRDLPSADGYPLRRSKSRMKSMSWSTPDSGNAL